MTISGYPVSGGLVYALDTVGNVAGYAMTDASGSYTITGLAPGVYSMTMDCHDYTSVTASNVNPSYNSSGTDVTATQDFVVSSEITSVPNVQSSSAPTTYSLAQNYPNPFNPTTQIRFNLSQMDKISLTVYNMLGQKIATLAEGEFQAGSYVVTWNGTNGHGMTVSSGVYFYRLSGSSFVITKKMLMLK
ncbi:MAG: T9SS type A sorting domain-containing protein [Bacteroidota bacterium]